MGIFNDLLTGVVNPSANTPVKDTPIRITQPATPKPTPITSPISAPASPVVSPSVGIFSTLNFSSGVSTPAGLPTKSMAFPVGEGLKNDTVLPPGVGVIKKPTDTFNSLTPEEQKNTTFSYVPDEQHLSEKLLAKQAITRQVGYGVPMQSTSVAGASDQGVFSKVNTLAQTGLQSFSTLLDAFLVRPITAAVTIGAAPIAQGLNLLTGNKADSMKLAKESLSSTIDQLDFSKPANDQFAEAAQMYIKDQRLGKFGGRKVQPEDVMALGLIGAIQQSIYFLNPETELKSVGDAKHFLQYAKIGESLFSPSEFSTIKGEGGAAIKLNEAAVPDSIKMREVRPGVYEAATTERPLKGKSVDVQVTPDFQVRLSPTKDGKLFVEGFKKRLGSTKIAPLSSTVKPLIADFNSLSDAISTMAGQAGFGPAAAVNEAKALYKASTPSPELTTTVLDKLQGRSTVSKQFISDLTNSGDLKQVERDMIREALSTESDTVDVPKFIEKVRAELLPLKRNDMVNKKYEGISLPDNVRGDVANYNENIYSSPIKTSAGEVHFGSGGAGNPNYAGKSYFGHTRIEDMKDGTRRVIEVQSDLYQKGRLESDIKNQQDAIDSIKSEGKVIDKNRQPEVDALKKLQQYNDPTAHFRMIREEVKQAAKDGKTILQFPTGETAMKIEGLGQGDNFVIADKINAGLEERTLTPEKMSNGMVVYNRGAGSDPWVITDILGDGKFKAVPKQISTSAVGMEAQNKPGVSGMVDFNDFSKDQQYNIVKALSEEFDISGKVDTNNPIYKFYEKDVGKYLKNKYGATLVTNKQGVKWWQVEVKPEVAQQPVNAFNDKKQPYDKVQSTEGASYHAASGGPRDYSTSPLKLKFKKEGSIKFPGQKITNSADLAFAFQEIEHNATESFYVVAMKGDKPIGVELQTMGTIDASLVDPFDILPMLRDKKADGFYVVHNHPSGNPEASSADVDLTRRLNDMAENSGMQMKGHAIIDGDRYGFIDNSGSSYTRPILKEFKGQMSSTAKYQKYVDWTGPRNEMMVVDSAEQLANFMKGLSVNWKDNMAVVFTDVRDAIQSVKVVPTEQVTARMIGELATSGRTKNVFLVKSGEIESRSPRQLQRDLLYLYNVNLVDFVSLAKNGSFVSGQAAGLVNDKAQLPMTPQELVRLTKARQEKMKAAMSSEAGAMAEVQIQNRQEELARMDSSIVDGIKNSPYYRKEGAIKDEMGKGWLMEKGGRFVVIEPKLVDKYGQLGYHTKIEIDSLAKEAGFEDGQSYLEDQLALSQLSRSTDARAETEKILEANDPEFAKINAKLSNINEQLDGETVSAKRLLLEQGKRELERRQFEQRKFKIRAVQEYFGLSDTQMKKINYRDLRTMDEQEYNDYFAKIQIEAFKESENQQAKNELVHLIQSRDLKRTENLQKAMKLPTIENMTTEQLRQFAAALEPYQQGDEFLSTRKLETLDRTDFTGAKTWREALDKVRAKTGLKAGEAPTSDMFDKFRNDTALAEKNPFYNYLVKTVLVARLKADANIEHLQTQVDKLFGEARKGTGAVNKVVPTDPKIAEYLESNDKLKVAETMTPAQIAAAEFEYQHYKNWYNYQIMHEGLKKSAYEGIYMPHIQRNFFEAVKDDGIKAALKEMLHTQKLDEQTQTILDEKTGKIVPFEKWFKFAQHRTGGVIPTQNAAKSFMIYAKAMENKIVLDSIIPEIMTATDILSPRKETPKGLVMDDQLKTFVSEYLNTRRGRPKGYFLKPGSKTDAVLLGIKAFTSLKDLGGNIFLQLGSAGGELSGLSILMKPEDLARGAARLATRRGRAIVRQYENYTGRTPWNDLFDKTKGLPEKAYGTMFAIFKSITTRRNKIHLLGSMTPQEYAAGKISPERLADLKIQLGRWMTVEGGKSVAGSSTEAKVGTQYLSWAFPMLRTSAKNLYEIAGMLKKLEGKKLLHSREAQELVRQAIIIAATALMAASVANEIKKHPNSFISKLMNKFISDLYSPLAALSIGTYTKGPRVISFIANLAAGLGQLVTFDKYKVNGSGYKKGELKGVNSLKKAILPSILIPNSSAYLGSTPDSITKKTSGSRTNPFKINSSVRANPFKQNAGGARKNPFK